MAINQLITIKDQLNRIEKKLDGKYHNRYLNIVQVSNLVSLSCSTIRRAIAKGELKYSRTSGKLLFQESDIKRWLNGKVH